MVLDVGGTQASRMGVGDGDQACDEGEREELVKIHFGFLSFRSCCYQNVCVTTSI
jgi:hypothetical protein